MKLLLLLLLVSCVEASPKSDTVERKYRVYFPERGAIRCARFGSGHSLKDCVDLAGRKIDTVYNATNIIEE
jgi:hypothetical protein